MSNQVRAEQLKQQLLYLKSNAIVSATTHKEDNKTNIFYSGDTLLLMEW